MPMLPTITKRFSLCQQQQKDFNSANSNKEISALLVTTKIFQLFQHH
jgi:hypothetical protein